MTLSALSMQMKTLEDDLNVALFDRTFRPPKLTPIGKKIVHDAKQVIEAEAKLRSHCSTSNELSGQFHIGFVASLAAHSLSEFLRLATLQAPQACFSFETGLSEILCEAVRSGRLDAAIVTEINEATADLESDPLFSEEMVIVTPNSQEKLDYKSLAENMSFFHFLPNSGIGRLIARFCNDLEAQPNHSIYLDNIEAIVNCVSDGLGFSLLPKKSCTATATAA